MLLFEISMTTQITNSLVYEGREWSIEGRRGQGYFSPEAEGLHCYPIATACYRGWIASFFINDERILTIDRLMVNLDDDYHTPESTRLFDRLPKSSEDMDWGNAIYESINVLIPFSGGLLIGDDYKKDRASLTHVFPAADFATARELIFDSGRLIEEYDRSELFEALFQFSKQLEQELRDPDDIGMEAFLQMVNEHSKVIQNKMIGQLCFDDYDDASSDG